MRIVVAVFVSWLAIFSLSYLVALFLPLAYWQVLALLCFAMLIIVAVIFYEAKRCDRKT